MVAMWLRRAMHGVLVSCFLCVSAAFGEDAVPAPIKMDNNDVAAFLAVTDIKSVFNTFSAIAKQANLPEQAKIDAIPAEIGKQVGDIGLTSLITTKPIVMILFKVPNGYDPKDGPPPIGVYVPLTPDSPILDFVKEGVKKDPSTQAVYEDGLLIVAPAPHLEKARSGK